MPRSRHASEQLIDKPLASVLLGAFCLAVPGCTTVSRIEAPPIHCAPDATGLVLLEVDITVMAAILGIRTPAEPVGGTMSPTEHPDAIVHGGASSGFVIFPDLSPGRWRLVMLEGKWQNGNSSSLNKYAPTHVLNEYRVPPESINEFTVDVRAGEPVFLSVKIDDDRRLSTTGIRYHLRTDAAAEAKAWKWMRDVYDKSAWEPIFSAKAGDR